MMKKTVLIVTEANATVASGHLFECLVLHEELTNHRVPVCLMVNSDIQPGLRARLPENYYEYNKNIQEECKFLASFIEKQSINVIVFNLREIGNLLIQELRNELKSPVTIAVIDEFGHRALDADIIINPMIDDYYWHYDTKGKVYCGAGYLILSRNIREYHKKEKEIRKDLKTITVSMGGVDLPGTTVRLAEWLRDILTDAQINLVIGAGFLHLDELKRLVDRWDNIHIYQNITNIFDFFIESDLVVCAGGNTLHELAAIGTPALVIPSRPHEIKNGRAFEKQGFSICCEDAEHITKDLLKQYIEQISEYQTRKHMSICGKKISDGNGSERVYSLLFS